MKDKTVGGNFVWLRKGQRMIVGDMKLTAPQYGWYVAYRWGMTAIPGETTGMLTYYHPPLRGLILQWWAKVGKAKLLVLQTDKETK